MLMTKMPLLTSVSDYMNPAATTTYSYDDKDLKKEVTEGGRTHTLEYDSKKQLVKKTLSNSMEEYFNYDTAGRLISQSLHSGGNQIGSKTYIRNNADQVINDCTTGTFGNYSTTY